MLAIHVTIRLWILDYESRCTLLDCAHVSSQTVRSKVLWVNYCCHYCISWRPAAHTAVRCWGSTLGTQRHHSLWLERHKWGWCKGSCGNLPGGQKYRCVRLLLLSSSLKFVPRNQHCWRVPTVGTGLHPPPAGRCCTVVFLGLARVASYGSALVVWLRPRLDTGQCCQQNLSLNFIRFEPKTGTQSASSPWWTEGQTRAWRESWG